MKKFYLASYILLAVLTAVTLVIAAVASFGVVLHAVAVIALIVFTILQIVCVLLYKGNGRNLIYRIGFMLLHIGLVLALVGCGVYALFGAEAYAPVPVGNGVYYSEVMKENGDLLQFDFSVSVKSFQVEVYPDTGSDKAYYAVVSIVNFSREETEFSLEVNKPIRYKGWKIYLMSYEKTDGITYTTLLFKKDPTEFITTAGFSMVIIGSFFMCLCPIERRKTA